MTKEEWVNKLKTDLSNRTGLGMYVLDTFFEEAAQLLAEHDAKLIKEFINNEFDMNSLSKEIEEPER